MHAVRETKAFQRAADAAGMSREEIDAFIGAPRRQSDRRRRNQRLRRLPQDLRGGEGQRRERRLSGHRPLHRRRFAVFLLTVFAKGERANLSVAELAGLAKLTAALAGEYRKTTTRGGETRDDSQ